MLERIILSALLAASVVGNAMQWWGGEQRYADGRLAERAAWQGVIDERNRQIEALSTHLTDLYNSMDTEREAAARRASAAVLQTVAPDVAAQCALPVGVVHEINLIRSGP